MSYHAALTGTRAEAWQRITQAQSRYAGYGRKTDRAIPVIRLSRAE